MSNSTWINEFGAHFQQSKTALQSRIETAKARPPVSASTLQEFTNEISNLMRTLADTSGSLPSYDQRQYELQVKALEKSIEELRGATAKPKFAFKRKAAATQPPPPQPKPAESNARQAESDAAPAVPSTNLLLSSKVSRYLTVADLPAPFKQESDLALADLDHCVVDLLRADDPALLNISAVHIRNVSNSVIVLPLISGSLMMHDISRCVLVVGCHQFRMHTSKAVDVYLSITSNPIIEHCSNIRFSPYPSSLSPDASDAGLKSIQDFSHIRATPSPNWTRVDRELQVDILGLLDMAKKDPGQLDAVCRAHCLH